MRFMCGHRLHGLMNSTPGASFSMLEAMEHSVTSNTLAPGFLCVAYSIMPAVEPIDPKKDLEADILAVRAGRSDLLIGVSTHGDAQVSAAVAGGADYLGFGPVYGTRTRQNPDPVQGIQGLARAVALAGDVGVVAIGGVTPEVAAVIAATGAAAACAIGAVNQATDPARAGRTIGDAWRA